MWPGLGCGQGQDVARARPTLQNTLNMTSSKLTIVCRTDFHELAFLQHAVGYVQVGILSRIWINTAWLLHERTHQMQSCPGMSPSLPGLSLASYPGSFLQWKNLGTRLRKDALGRAWGKGQSLLSTITRTMYNKHYCGIEVYYTQELREGESNQMSTHLQRRLRTLSHVPVYQKLSLGLRQSGKTRQGSRLHDLLTPRISSIYTSA